MSESSHFDGEITITPPLTWNECRVTPGTDDAEVRSHEEITDGEFGQTRVLTGVAIVAKKFAHGHCLPASIQAIIDAHPKHEFSGHIEEWVELGYRILPRRHVVRGRQVVAVEAAWPDEQPQDERDAEILRLRANLDEMTRCRDNALAYAERQHVPIQLDDEIDIDGEELASRIEGDLLGPGWDWDDDRTPGLLARQMVAVVRLHLARLTDQAQKARAAVIAAQDERDGDLLIGPLTAAEWCAFRLRDDGGELLRCCSVTSQFRDALFDVLRAGAGVDCAPMLRPEWEALVRHGLPEGVPQLERIRAFYELPTEQEVAALDARNAKVEGER